MPEPFVVLREPNASGRIGALVAKILHAHAISLIARARVANFKRARVESEAATQVGDAQLYAAFSKRRTPVVVCEILAEDLETINATSTAAFYVHGLRTVRADAGGPPGHTPVRAGDHALIDALRNTPLRQPSNWAPPFSDEPTETLLRPRSAVN